MLVRSIFISEGQKALARKAFDTLATHAGVVHDIIDTDCRAQDGSTQGRALETFKRRFFKKQ